MYYPSLPQLGRLVSGLCIAFHVVDVDFLRRKIMQHLARMTSYVSNGWLHKVKRFDNEINFGQTV